MENRNITVIPARKRTGGRTEERQTPMTRVAAYCRVSTDHDEQEDSLENQIAHYENEIRSNPNYEFVEVYYDLGISGFKEKRQNFQRMLQDAREGKIDLIITKSISRFARNTDTVLKATRELKALNVAVYFELQGINTLTSEGELMMTVYAAFAQAESESNSALAKMAYQRRYEAGIPVQYLERCYGYDRNEAGEFIIKEDEAKWVRKIYQMIADGYTAAAVKRYLNDNGVKTVQGAEWIDSTVFRIVESEIYKGDYIMQKTYVNDERKQVKNRGQVNSWYAENDHVPIVSKRLWQKAQDALRDRRHYRVGQMDIKEITPENYPYYGRIFCAYCGQPLYPRKYSKGHRLNWGCAGQKRYGADFCHGVPTFTRKQPSAVSGNMTTTKRVTGSAITKRSRCRRRLQSSMMRIILLDSRSTVAYVGTVLPDTLIQKAAKSHGCAIAISITAVSVAGECEYLMMRYENGCL